MSQIEDAKTILRILLSFMVIDNEVNIKEKEIIVNFLKTKFGESAVINFNLAEYKGTLNHENFALDAEKIVLSKTMDAGDRMDTIKLIADLIKSDGVIHDKEIILFEILLEKWHIKKESIADLGIKKSLWSKLFGE